MRVKYLKKSSTWGFDSLNLEPLQMHRPKEKWDEEDLTTIRKGAVPLGTRKNLDDILKTKFQGIRYPPGSDVSLLGYMSSALQYLLLLPVFYMVSLEYLSASGHWLMGTRDTFDKWCH